MDGFLGAIILALPFIILKIRDWWCDREVEDEFLYDNAVHHHIEEIAHIDEQLQAVEELITDIETSSPDLLKNFTLTRHSVAGKKIEVDIMIDGRSDVTDQMMILMEAKREQLLERLEGEMEVLPCSTTKKVKWWIRRGQNMDKTSRNVHVDKTEGVWTSESDE